MVENGLFAIPDFLVNFYGSAISLQIWETNSNIRRLFEDVGFEKLAGEGDLSSEEKQNLCEVPLAVLHQRFCQKFRTMRALKNYLMHLFQHTKH